MKSYLGARDMCVLSAGADKDKPVSATQSLGGGPQSVGLVGFSWHRSQTLVVSDLTAAASHGKRYLCARARSSKDDGIILCFETVSCFPI